MIPITTVVNNPQSAPGSTGDSGSGLGMGMVVGIIIIIAIVALVLFMMPRWRAGAPVDEVNPGTDAGVNIVVPDEVDVNIEGLPNPDGQP